ncbi:TadE/TadG family type IV pilus assembly protein [Sphingomonas sp.]|uniref:TadE/TadG family type IV pilus assembly protein n=1 Tax=Sphingomonas sp. TaxID=28214 RepID=UPI0025E68CC6|nr:TadE/TadG family type IV pilus assembly protein [Sphingomonas sp.]
MRKWLALPSFVDDRRGAALIEFALLLPFLVLVYLGGFTLSDGFSCSRKVTIANRALADLVAQNVTGATSANEVDSELAASTQVLAPYSAANVTQRVTEVYTDIKLQSTVVWSRGLNTTAYKAGAAVTVPLNLRVPGLYVIYAEITYAYQPPVTFNVVQPFTLTSNLFMLPRNSNSITCGDC